MNDPTMLMAIGAVLLTVLLPFAVFGMQAMLEMVCLERQTRQVLRELKRKTDESGDAKEL